MQRLDPILGRQNWEDKGLVSTANMPDHPRLTTDPEICAAYAADVSGLAQVPPAVARPESEGEVVEIVRRCADRGIPITAQGLRSSTTGASVAAAGIVLSLERMDRLIDIDRAGRFAIVEPGLVTSDFKQHVEAAGLFYPPDPTSEEESTLGGNVACNASGSRTYRYGPTRAYVRALRVVMADGSVTEVRRCEANKNAAGYYGLQNPIDPWIGSEGTLGIITSIELQLLQAPPGFFGALAFFPDWPAAIRFVQVADGDRRLQPRCLEFFDGAALELLQPVAGGLHIPAQARAAIFFEEEADPAGLSDALAKWLQAIDGAGGLSDETLIAQNGKEQRALRKLRHHIPSTMNERGLEAVAHGGRRVSTDFAVPLAALPRMMTVAYDIIAADFGGYSICYGHVGNGHPHFNLLAENPEDLRKGLAVAHRMVAEALALGGTLSAEHGIGKIKAPLFRALYPEWLLRGMLGIKRALDPNDLLAPGNIFSKTTGEPR